jgi:hypothetical protein
MDPSDKEVAPMTTRHKYARMAAIAAIALLAVLIRQSPAHASWLTWYAEERLTDDPSASYLSPNGARSVACDTAGNIHVVFADYRTGTSGIYHKFYDRQSPPMDPVESMSYGRITATALPRSTTEHTMGPIGVRSTD